MYQNGTGNWENFDVKLQKILLFRQFLSASFATTGPIQIHLHMVYR
jgi:hypothetical protein